MFSGISCAAVARATRAAGIMVAAAMTRGVELHQSAGAGALHRPPANSRMEPTPAGPLSRPGVRGSFGTLGGHSMMTGSDIGATRYLAVLMLVGGVVAGQAQSGPSLNALTVPHEVLPSRCALSQPVPGSVRSAHAEGARTVVSSVGSAAFPTNPWSGTDRKLVTEVRKAMDGTPRLPDGPPLEPADAEAFLLKLADDVVEAYRAVYVSADGAEVGVWAVRFNDDALAKPEPPPGMINPPTRRGFRNRVVQGATVVLVTAPSPNECVRAIDGYIRSLK
jgi:hypothetical protein